MPENLPAVMPGANASVAAFLGRWHVRRKIVDRLAMTVAAFEGIATITPESFEEKGTLVSAGATTRATRVYRLEFMGGERVAVRFPDGSDFVALRASPVQAVVHVCGADRYAGRFFFVDADRWAEAWRVTGPRKRYASLSRYRRAPERR